VAGFQESKLGNAIDRFYEAAVQPDLWRPVLQEFSEAIGAEGALLIPGPEAALAPVCSEGIDELIDTGVRENWIAGNPRVTRGMPAMRRAQDIMTESRIFTPDELDRLPFYADFADRFGFRWFAGTFLVSAGPASVILSAERKKRDEPFSPREIEGLARALPHIQRAGQVALRLAESRAQGMLDAFDQMSCGGVLIDLVGRAIRLNLKAQRQIGRGLTLTHGQLLTGHREANAMLQRLIGSVLHPGPAQTVSARGAVAIPRPTGRPLIVHAAPIVGSARDMFQRAKAILMLIDPDDHREPAEPVLRQAFGLTPAETRLAIGLARGHDLSELSEAFKIGTGTARAQLKAIFAKTGTHRQGELVALLGRLVVP